MFFDAAYVDEEALTESDPATGATVSSLLLLPYSMNFCGESLGVAYVYGAGTLKKFRAKGHMGRLLKRSLREAAERGDSLAVLIPASEALQGYYKRFGFASVFYRQPERYTSIHRFPVEGSYVDVSARPASELFPAFERLMGKRDYCIQHSSAQFLTAMEDSRMSGYGFAAVCRDDDEHSPCAMAWGRHEDTSDDIIVTELLAEDPDAANAVIGLLQSQMPDRPVTLMRAAPDDYIGGNLAPEGMARVVNPETFLAAIAASNPKLKLSIRLNDHILTENTGIYTLHDGKLTVSDIVTDPDYVPDLDLTPETLTSMLFSSRRISEITGLPARRPEMSLMLN